jgi:hypothetical protein
MVDSYQPRGQSLAVGRRPVLSLVLGSGSCIIIYGKLFLLGGAYSLAGLSLHLGVFPRSSDVRR